MKTTNNFLVILLIIFLITPHRAIIINTITITINDATTTVSTSTTMTTTASSTTTFTKPPMSFYRRPLPDTCTALSSKRGRQYFQSALDAKGLKSFFHLMEQHTTQAEPAYCGICTLTMCLNAMAVDPKQQWNGSPWRWYSESMLNCCMSLDEIKKTGITIKTFNCLAKCQGLSTQVHYAEDSESNENHFRNMVKQACVEDESANDDDADDDDECDKINQILVVSYNRQGLGQTGTGHFSPIGAYDSTSDMVLILDTARFKYGVHWVRLPTLYEAMLSKDPDTGKSRGYVMLMNNDDDNDIDNEYNEEKEDLKLSSSSWPHPHPHSLPVSVLLRTKMNQSDVRRKYKQYLETTIRESDQCHDVSFENVVRYWTQNYSNPNYVFEMVDAQYKPCANEIDTIQLIDQVRSLIQALLTNNGLTASSKLTSTITSTTSSGGDVDGDDYYCQSKCRPNGSRLLDLKPEEIMYIVYLASIDDINTRHEIVYGGGGGMDDNNNNNKEPNATSKDSDDDDDSAAKLESAAAAAAARRQLLSEAELIRSAIDVSDQV